MKVTQYTWHCSSSSELPTGFWSWPHSLIEALVVGLDGQEFLTVLKDHWAGLLRTEKVWLLPSLDADSSKQTFISIYLVQTVSLISSPATIPNRCWPRWRKVSFSAVLAGAQPEIGQSHLFVWEFGTCSRSASMESALAELAFDATNQELDDDNEFLNDKGTRTGTKHPTLITLPRWGGPIWVWFCKHRWRSEPRRNRCWR